MKFLIAGLGSVGRRHLRNLLELGERNIILFRTHQSTLPDKELMDFPVETDLRAALAHKPDAVIISNPTAYHLEVAIPAAECGCHILIEKPISHSMARVDEFVQAVQENDCKVEVGYQFRYHPGLQQVKKLLEENAIGQPLSVRAHWGEYLPGWHPWEDYTHGYAARSELGGGVVLTLSHPLDYLHWLLGEVDSVWAFTSRIGLNLPVEDCAEIGLDFKNGVIGSVHLDYIQRLASHSLEIIGTHGIIRWDNSDGITRQLQVNQEGKVGAWREFYPPKGFERNWMFLEELRHFRDMLRGAAQPVCTLNDGIFALKLAVNSILSAQQKATINM